MPRGPKRPRDLNQWAKHVVDLATGAAQEPPASQPGKTASETGRQGGRARAAKISPSRRSEIARDAARKRWKKP